MESNLESSRPFKSTEIIADLQTEILMLIKRSVFDVNSAIRFRSNLFKIIDENIKEIENKEFRAVARDSLVAFAEKSISEIINKFNLRVLTILIFFEFTKNNKLIDLKQSQQTINETINKIPIRTIQNEFISLANSQPKVKTQSLQSYSELNERYNENKEMVSGLKAKTNLVICDTHSNCSARCFPWQGRVYSLDGSSGTTSDGRKYVPLEVATNVRDKYGNTNGLLGFNCFDKETEVLTDKGWKFFKDLDGNEKFYTLDIDTRETEWQKAINSFKRWNNCEMVQVKGYTKDLVITEDHEMLYFTDKNKKLRRKNAIDLSKWDWQYCGQVWKSGKETFIRIGDKEIGSRLYCKLLAYYLADGSIHDESSIKIAQQNNEKMFNELRELPFKVWRDENKIIVRSKDLVNKFRVYGKCNTKYVEKEVKELPIEDLTEFLDAYIKTDGYIAKNKKTKSIHKEVFTSSYQMCADLCEIALKCGYRPSVSVLKNKGKEVEFKNGKYKLNYDIFVIHLNKSNNFRVGETKLIKYCDYVYCVEVPNHTLLVKRNGKIQWCGNCRHKLTEYRDGKEPLTVSKQEQKKQYALNNEQRLYEREIRNNKQKAEMSVLEADKSKYKAKARELTAKYKEFCQDNQLVEYRSRLKI